MRICNVIFLPVFSLAVFVQCYSLWRMFQLLNGEINNKQLERIKFDVTGHHQNNAPNELVRDEEMPAEQRIILVSYVFGEEAANRRYLRMFTESARGSGVDIAIVGSPVPPFPLSPNVGHFRISWEEFAERVSTRLFQGRKLSRLKNAHPHKINDFKPLIAFLFPEVVRDYDWWGYVDNDLILGNVRHFVTPEMLRNYDIISKFKANAREPKGKGDKITWGPFSMFRNQNSTNQLFMLSGQQLDRVLNNRNNLSYDEYGNRGQYKASMSGIINEHGDRLGLRWRRPTTFPTKGDDPVFWGNDCKRKDSRDSSRCFDCLLTMSFRGGQEQILIDQGIGSGKEVLLCHFRKGKDRAEASLANPEVHAQIVADGRLRLSTQGFAPVSNTI